MKKEDISNTTAINIKETTYSTLLKTTIGIASAAALMTRRGPRHAFMLYIRSKYFIKPVRRSQRIDEVKGIKLAIDQLSRYKYLVFKGPKGIGKTCAIQTALSDVGGVVYINSIRPGTKSEKIYEDSIKTVTIDYKSEFDNDEYARRILWWFSLFGKKPIIVIPASERYPGQKFAEIPYASIRLTEMGFKVLIDSSENALQGDPYGKEDIWEMKPMTIETVSSLEQFQELFEFLEKNNLLAVSLMILGGTPLSFDELNDILNNIPNDEQKLAAVKDFLNSKIENAIIARDKIIRQYPKIKDTLENFKGKIEFSFLNNLLETPSKPYPDLKKIFRIYSPIILNEETGEERWKTYYGPVNQQIKIVLETVFSGEADYKQIPISPEVEEFIKLKKAKSK
jgi:hypothetical protein